MALINIICCITGSDFYAYINWKVISIENFKKYWPKFLKCFTIGSIHF